MTETAHLKNGVASISDDEYEVIDISIPVSEKTACFPGDTPFSCLTTVSYKDSGIINLTAFTMSPHVGTHADSPVHIQGELTAEVGMVSDLPLSPFIGACKVVDISDYREAISRNQLLATKPQAFADRPTRILFKTLRAPNHHKFDEPYAYFDVDLIDLMAANNVKLLGIDTPSVDFTKSKSLDTHHRLLNANMSWLENLDLSNVSEGNYFLCALPLKLSKLEASPVRAVLLSRRSR